MLARQVGRRIVGRAEQAEALRRQRRGDDRRRRQFVRLVPGGADPEPDAADPGGDAGAGGQLAQQFGDRRRGRLGDVENAQIRLLPFRQLRQTA